MESGAVRLHDRQTDDDLSFDERDSAPFTAEGLRGRSRPSPGGAAPRRRTPWEQTVIYEAHVQRLHQAASRRAGDAARHLRRAWRARRSSTTVSRSA